MESTETAQGEEKDKRAQKIDMEASIQKVLSQRDLPPPLRQQRNASLSPLLTFPDDELLQEAWHDVTDETIGVSEAGRGTVRAAEIWLVIQR